MAKSQMPTIDEDLDQVVRSGAGRRVLMHLLKPIQGPLVIHETPEKTAYEIGRINVLRELDEWLKDVNLQCWLLMHREYNEQDDTASLTLKED